MADSHPYTKLTEEATTDDDELLMATETGEKPALFPSAPPPYAPNDYSMNSLNPVVPLEPNRNYPVQPQAPVPPPQMILMPTPPPVPQQTVVVVGSGVLPPGTCSVCRKGKIKDSASCCTWFWCCLLLPLGIIPGIIAFCCCCRHPKCTKCGYTV